MVREFSKTTHLTKLLNGNVYIFIVSVHQTNMRYYLYGDCNM